MGNEQCKSRPFLIDLNPVPLKYYPHIITLVKCNGYYMDTILVKHQIEFGYQTKHNMIIRKIEPKKLSKHIPCECKCKFQILNNNTCKNKKKTVYEKGCIWNLATCSCENCRYAGISYMW